MKRRRFVLLLPMFVILASAGAAGAQPRFCQGTGHYYDVVWAESLNWRMAKTAAEMLTFEHDLTVYRGHLATITSAEEDDCVSALLPRYERSSWAVYLGGFQPPGVEEPAGGWQWVTGEPFEYANWSAGQPDDGNGSNENIVMYSGPRSGADGAGAIQWKDAQGRRAARGFIVEYETGHLALNEEGPSGLEPR